jgi:hypothetical protein
VGANCLFHLIKIRKKLRSLHKVEMTYGCLFEWNREISMTLYRSLHYSRDDIRLSFRVEPRNLYDFIQISPQGRDDIRLSFRVEPRNLYDFIQISPQGQDDIRLSFRALLKSKYILIQSILRSKVVESRNLF